MLTVSITALSIDCGVSFDVDETARGCLYVGTMDAHELMEQSEHIAHAGHGGHGEEEGHAAHSKLGTYIGLTMAILGVLLAFCAAKVGGERTELVQTLVEQQNAHAKYQAQDIKHRVAFLQLQAVHASGAANVVKADVLSMVRTVERYLEESKAAKEWVEAFDPVVSAHVTAQEHFETAQLAAEIGIVIASVALLTKKKPAWYVALLLGLGSLGMVGWTFQHTDSIMSTGEARIRQTEKVYRELRDADKSTAYEAAFLEQITRSVDDAHEPAGKGL